MTIDIESVRATMDGIQDGMRALNIYRYAISIANQLAAERDRYRGHGLGQQQGLAQQQLAQGLAFQGQFSQ